MGLWAEWGYSSRYMGFTVGIITLDRALGSLPSGAVAQLLQATKLQVYPTASGIFLVTWIKRLLHWQWRLLIMEQSPADFSYYIYKNRVWVMWKHFSALIIIVTVTPLIF